jgi:putative peptidoglycan binding protein
VVFLAAVAALVGRQIRSPAQIAADTAAPKASLISVPVERRALATEVIVRGTVRYGAPQEVVLPVSALKSSTSVVSRVPKPGAKVGEGETALVISGRPVFVLQGATPMHRDMGPGTQGEDVKQLEQALARAGFAPGAVDGRYDAATTSAVAAFYLGHNETPFGPTDTQLTDLRAAAQSAATARDALLQTRLTLRTAARGATPADRNQARLDAAAAAEAIAPARLAIATGQNKADTARGAIDSATVAEADATSTGNRDIAVADADVVTKRAAANDAVDQVAVAQAKLNDAPPPPDTPAGEYEALKASVRQAQRAVEVANADLAAARQGAASARTALGTAVAKARADGRQAARDLVLAEAELRAARSGLTSANRKRALADARVRILNTPANTALEQRLVASSQREAARTQNELNRLAGKTGVQVPADEVLFFPTLPLRVDTLAARRGSQLQGSVMTVTNARLAIDSSLSVLDANLVRPGMRVAIEEQELRVRIQGRVSRVADKPGTLPTDLVGTATPDPTRTYLEVVPRAAPPSLVGTSVKLSIAVKSTRGKVLAVPVGALSISADGKSRVQVDLGGGRTKVVRVTPGLAAQGFVEVEPDRKGALSAGDLVVIGSGPSSATRAPTRPGGKIAPSPRSTAGGGGSAGAGPTTTPATPASSAAPTGTPTQALPAPSAAAPSAAPTQAAPGAPRGP